MLLTKLTDNNIKIYKANAKNVRVSGISSNSKKIKKGMIFAAVNGYKERGVSYAEEVVSQGVSTILCEEADIKKIKKKAINILVSKDVRKAIGQVAKKFYPKQPRNIIAVTGTNGKTSIVDFLRKIWKKNNIKGATIGTLGIQTKQKIKRTNLTTLDPVSLHEELNNLKNNKIDFLAIEASSHAIVQCRLDEVDIKFAVFTNLSRDHLDFHKNMNNYFLAKTRLFEVVLNKKGTAIINTDSKYGKKLKEICDKNKIKNYTYGRNKFCDWMLLEVVNKKNISEVSFKKNNTKYKFECNFFADYEIENLLCAILLANLNGIAIKDILNNIKTITRPEGRLNKIKVKNEHFSVFIDYAHTPEALQNSLLALKSKLSKTGKLFLLFGCGGERDKGKRKIMGKIASKLADKVFITDDNPRYECAKSIRDEIASNSKNFLNIAGRKKAIHKSISLMKKNYILLIAGKGHEKTQEIQGRKIAFDDQKVAKEAILVREKL